MTKYFPVEGIKKNNVKIVYEFDIFLTTEIFFLFFIPYFFLLVKNSIMHKIYENNFK
jgi:hypothetical protein